MDEYLAFQSVLDCQNVLNRINELMFQKAVTDGYDINGGITGKCQGVSNPNAAKTTTWANPVEVDGTWYVPKPAQDLLDVVESEFTLQYGDMPQIMEKEI